MKTLSEVGFEPTPTFVDQNTPVRKSSTLESGALDRSAILTRQFVKNNEARIECSFYEYVSTKTEPQVMCRVILNPFIMTRQSSDGIHHNYT